jgi:hypothetical protein
MAQEGSGALLPLKLWRTPAIALCNFKVIGTDKKTVGCGIQRRLRPLVIVGELLGEKLHLGSFGSAESELRFRDGKEKFDALYPTYYSATSSAGGGDRERASCSRRTIAAQQ